MKLDTASTEEPEDTVLDIQRLISTLEHDERANEARMAFGPASRQETGAIPCVSALDVAEYVLRKLGRMSTMKLQKLVYYCQAWSLVWDEKPLFSEEIEAWANGPVIRELFNYHRGVFDIEHVYTGNPALLTDEQCETVDAVLSFLGDKSAQWLIELSHSELPWQQARRDLPESARGSRTISHDSMAEYYSSLLQN